MFSDLAGLQMEMRHHQVEGGLLQHVNLLHKPVAMKGHWFVISPLIQSQP